MKSQNKALLAAALVNIFINVGCEMETSAGNELPKETNSAKSPTDSRSGLKTLSCSTQELDRFDFEPSFRYNGGTQEPQIIKQDKDGTLFVAGVVLSASAPTTEGWAVRRMDKNGRWTTVDNFSHFARMDQYSMPLGITINENQIHVIGQKILWDRTARDYRIAHLVRESVDQGNTWRTLAESEYPIDLQYDYPLHALYGSTDSPAKKIADGSLVRVIGPKTFDSLLWNPEIGEKRIERSTDRINWTVVARVENTHDELKSGIYRNVTYTDKRDGSLEIITSEEVSTTGFFDPTRKTLYRDFAIYKFELTTAESTLIEKSRLEDPYKMKIDTLGLPGIGWAASLVINGREIQFRYLDTKKNMTGRIRSEDGQSWIELGAVSGSVFIETLDWVGSRGMIPLSEVTLADGRGVSIGAIAVKKKPIWVVNAYKCSLR